MVGVAHSASTTAPIYAHATRGVVLATGGYQAGHLLRQRYQPARAAQSPYYGTSNCRGDGHVMGAAVGADLVNMTYLPPTVLAASTVVENAIAVNTGGVRFHDEAGSFETGSRTAGARGSVRLVHPRRRAPRGPGAADRADAELAGARGHPHRTGWRPWGSGRMRWRPPSSSGTPSWPPARSTDHLGRSAVPQDRRGLCQGPFTAVPMVEGVNISCGGFRTTARMQVVDVLGRAVADSFAAGTPPPG